MSVIPINLRDDLLIGAKAIADYTGFTQRQIYHFAETRGLPIGRAGKLLTGRKSELNAALTGLPREAAPAA